MTREAKIGMLTGLGVIVLIGTLLSEYLGGGPHGVGATGNGAMGRMAALPMGAAYRQEIMQPVGVPSLVRNDGASVAPGAGAGVVATPSMTGAPLAPAAPVGSGTDAGGAPRLDSPLSNGPAMNQPVAAVPAGTVQMDAGMQQASIPTMQMPASGVQTVYVPGQAAAPAAGQARGTLTPAGPVTAADLAPAAAAKPAGEEYVIVPGDNLAKIAKKFYKSSKNSDIQRIVAANPAMLKNDKSVLIAGKKLLIPTVERAAAVEGSSSMAAAVPAMPTVKEKTVIRKPGSGEAVAREKAAAEARAKKAAGKVYVVQAHDTLGKIAQKFGVGVKELMAANGIKDAKGLQVGAKLKVVVE
ncbi:MAG: LysM peptidoglycan-binding domain-containing protein [Phycisphaerae bacterium]